MLARKSRRTALVALSAATVALVAAGPAAAESKTPTAPPAKKGCEVQLKGPGAGGPPPSPPPSRRTRCSRSRREPSDTRGPAVAGPRVVRGCYQLVGLAG